VAVTGSEALLKAGMFQPHLLLLDLSLPDLPGDEVCRQIKGHPQTQGIKIVAMSANPQMLQQARARSCEADAWLAKPFTLRELLAQGAILLGPLFTPMVGIEGSWAAGLLDGTSLPASIPSKGATDGHETLR
jgi:CheY-like chemotaxis protein